MQIGNNRLRKNPADTSKTINHPRKGAHGIDVLRKLDIFAHVAFNSCYDDCGPSNHSSTYEGDNWHGLWGKNRGHEEDGKGTQGNSDHEDRSSETKHVTEQSHQRVAYKTPNAE